MPLLTSAYALDLVPQEAEVAIHAVQAQWPLVSSVALARPISLSAAISITMAIPAAGPLGPSWACLGDTNPWSEDAVGVASVLRRVS